jgi:Holliday junction resolvase RusA-like endonuclease
MKFEIQGDPIAKARARIVRIKGRSVSYDPQEAEKLKVRNNLIYQLSQARSSENREISKEAIRLPLAAKLSVDIETHHPIPKSLSKANRIRIYTNINR